MIVHRFMGKQEYLALIDGKPLRSSTNHRKNRKYRSASVGFCFFTEDPDEAVHWLSGIADLDFCVTMEVPDDFLVPSWGVYLDDERTDLSKPMNYQEFMRSAKLVKRREYCRSRYSLSDVKILSTTQKYYSLYPPRSMHQSLMKDFLSGKRV